jgi:phage terminase large subunit-like protein
MRRQLYSEKLPEALRPFWEHRFAVRGRASQIEGALADWTTWIVMGGRGSGKTRLGAEWVRSMVYGDPFYGLAPTGRLALVGETYGDAREVMVEGESGILAVSDGAERPVWTPSRRRLEWSNGAVAHVFSSEDPDALRGPQFSAAWCDELAKWSHMRETWDMLQFGLRLGEHPCQLVTTTPRPVPLLKELVAAEGNLVTHMRTAENKANLAGGFLDRVVKAYRGTRLGRQELDGEIIEERTDALWTRALLEKARCKAPQDLVRIVIAVDPPVTGKASSDACGIIAVGQGADGRAYVLEDATLSAVSPERWSAAVVALYHSYRADRIVVETNQGGDMVESVLRTADPSCAVRQVKATRGKYLRAEPVAHLYERGLVSHCPSLGGDLALLEDEMCDFALDGLSTSRSPDRLDALVWGLTDLMLTRRGGAPRARSL